MKNISTNSRGGVTAYLAPEIEVAEIMVEAGFATSTDADYSNSWGDPTFTGGSDNNEIYLD